jgi:hypothetical protein
MTGSEKSLPPPARKYKRITVKPEGGGVLEWNGEPEMGTISLGGDDFIYFVSVPDPPARELCGHGGSTTHGVRAWRSRPNRSSSWASCSRRLNS